MLRLATALMAFLLLGIGAPPCAIAAQGEVYFERPAADPDDGFDEPDRVPESVGDPLLPPKTDAEGSDGEKDEDDGEGGEEPGQTQTLVDTAHKSISSGVLATARWLDSFFADPRVENEISKTRVKVRFSLFSEKDNAAEYDMRANLRLDLPVLENKLHLLIAGDPEEEDDFQTISGREGEQPVLASADDDFSTSLRYFLVDTLERNFSLRSGLRWRSGMPTLFLEPRYRQSVPLDSWLFRFTQRLIGFTDGKTGVRTTFDFERELRKPLFFRTTADGSWTSDEDGYFYSLNFSVFQRFSPRRVLSYNWGNFFRTRPHNQLDNVVLSVRYRQRILRDWLFYEIVPQLSFPDELDREATPAILLRLEMLFGHYPTLPAPPE